MRLFYPHTRRDHRWRDRHHGFRPLHSYADIIMLRFLQTLVDRKTATAENFSGPNIDLNWWALQDSNLRLPPCEGGTRGRFC